MRALLVVALVAAEAHAEGQLWTEVGVRRDLGDRVTVTFDQHLRFDDGPSRVGSVMPELGVAVRLASFLRLAAGYRFEYERDGDGDMVVRHRVHLAARSRLDVSWLRLEHRLQLQDSIRPSSRDVHRHQMRNRGELIVRRWRPFTGAVAAELFHALDDGDAIHLDKTWLTVTAGYGRGKNDLEVFYRIELPHADPDDPTLHIVGIGYHREL